MINCEPSPECIEWPNCFRVIVDDVRVCKAVYLAMVSSIPDHPEYVEVQVDREDNE